MKTARINGLTIRYTDTDPGDSRPALVLGHGFLLGLEVFDRQVEAFRDQWRVITWDARGHGGTPDVTEGTYDYWDQASDVAQLLDQLGVESAVVGGVSQGGFTALRLALLRKSLVRALVLWDTEATACQPQDKAAYGAMFAAMRHAIADGDTEAFAGLTDGLSRQLLGDHDSAEGVRAFWRARWMTGPLPLGLASTCLQDRDDVADRLQEIDVPVLLMRGEFDASIPAERMDLLRDRLPQAHRVNIVAGAAHTPTATDPERVNELLEQFFQTLPAPTADPSMVGRTP